MAVDTYDQLLQTYSCGEITWTKFTGIGVAPNSLQYNSGDEEYHITVNYNGATGKITGVHYTILNKTNVRFHLYYYLDANEYSIDFKGTLNPQTIDITLAKTRLGTWCVVSQYAIQANNGTFMNFEAFENYIEEEKAKMVPKEQRRKKRGKEVTYINLTGGGKY